MKQLRLVAWILFLSMLVVSAVACSETQGNDADDTAAASIVTDAVTEEELSEREKMKDNVPELNFNGESLRIAIGNDTAYEVFSEEENGDVCNDAIYARNVKVAERFNVVIEPIVIVNTDIQNNVGPVILAGDDAYDLISLHACRTGIISLQGLYYNWYDIPYIELDKPWYVQSVVDQFTINGVLFDLVGDFSITSLMYSYVTYYNINKAQDYNVENLYDVVYDKKWTLDYLTALTKDMYNDVNGDGKQDKDDFYGYAITEYNALDAILPSFGIPIVAKDADGMLSLAINSDKTVNALERMYTLMYDNNSSYVDIQVAGVPEVFANGNAMFYTSTLEIAFNILRSMGDDYGILPMPMFDETQEAYNTNSKDWYSVYGVPVTAKNLEKIGACFEALNCESYRTIYPTYFETALKAKFARDIDSLAMLDIIVAGRNYDFVISDADRLGGVTWLFRNLLVGKNKNFASAYKGAEKTCTARLEQIYNFYVELAANQ